MARTHRITVLLDDSEWRLFKGVGLEDERMATTVRRLALDRAKWFADRGTKARPKMRMESSPMPEWANTGPDQSPWEGPLMDDGEYRVDGSEGVDE